MLEMIFHLAVGETLGTVRDYVNAKSVSVPLPVPGVAASLKMRFFARKDGGSRRYRVLGKRM